MEQEQLIPAKIICAHHQIDETFIISLESSGLIEVNRVEGQVFVHPSQLNDLEKFIFFHYELDINVEGIEAIANLLQRMHDMQQELDLLRRKLHRVAKNSSNI
jgi:chaperone modulatory protein CbpM